MIGTRPHPQRHLTRTPTIDRPHGRTIQVPGGLWLLIIGGREVGRVASIATARRLVSRVNRGGDRAPTREGADG
jgi:hypothetical protein